MSDIKEADEAIAKHYKHGQDGRTPIHGKKIPQPIEKGKKAMSEVQDAPKTKGTKICFTSHTRKITDAWLKENESLFVDVEGEVFGESIHAQFIESRDYSIIVALEGQVTPYLLTNAINENYGMNIEIRPIVRRGANKVSAEASSMVEMERRISALEAQVAHLARVIDSIQQG